MPHNQQFSRRSFVRTSLAAGAGLAALGSTSPAFPLANDEIGIGIIGCGGRGGELSGGFKSQPGARIVAVADPDQGRAAALAKKVDAKQHYSDLRELLDDSAVDVVVVSTCNHWHCLASIWAMQAGKDVYVEKPLSHSQWEGRQVVNASRKYDKIVQLGTQQRSDPMQAELKKFLHEDKALGPIQYAQANRLGTRGSIGKRATPLAIPEGVNYDLWLGPAQDLPIYRNQLHYDWHWDWNTGSGEMGNWGVHVLDDVRNVAYQDTVSTPQSFYAVGGRVGWNDAGESPNVHYVYFDTGTFPCFIALSNLSSSPGGKGGWYAKAGRPVNGPGSGYIVACEGGYLLGSRGQAKAYDRDGKEIRAFKGARWTTCTRRTSSKPVVHATVRSRMPKSKLGTLPLAGAIWRTWPTARRGPTPATAPATSCRTSPSGDRWWTRCTRSSIRLVSRKGNSARARS
ncbi:MAG: Gfo/Idh/MocA family oxidoreductase [Planctomycetaceae bacterium]